jgi:hypothetical protein
MVKSILERQLHKLGLHGRVVKELSQLDQLRNNQ